MSEMFNRNLCNFEKKIKSLKPKENAKDILKNG